MIKKIENKKEKEKICMEMMGDEVVQSVRKNEKWRLDYMTLLKSIQHINNGVVPDSKFLASLRQVSRDDLTELSIPKELKRFLIQVGLPPKIQFIREPEEKDVPEVYFPLDKFSIRKIEKSEYLSVGGWRIEEQLYDEIRRDGMIKELKDTYEGKYLIDINTKDVWYVNYFDLEQTEDIWHFKDTDFELQFVNSSIEQFVLSMACWKSFYPQFEKKYLEVDGDLEYIFEHDELYEPFQNTMQILDARALEGEVNHWSFMCDLSLY